MGTRKWSFVKCGELERAAEFENCEKCNDSVRRIYNEFSNECRLVVLLSVLKKTSYTVSRNFYLCSQNQFELFLQTFIVGLHDAILVFIRTF